MPRGAGFPATAIDADMPISALLARVRSDTATWFMGGHVRPWFRGQADAGEPPKGAIFRHRYDEFWMTAMFRLKAIAFGQTPETNRMDQWLFLMQHHGLPTRLLDWSESPLAACFFAVERWIVSEKPEENYKSRDLAVWMIHPVELNKLTDPQADGFPNTWAEGNTANENVRMAFHSHSEWKQMMKAGRLRPSRYPLAVLPSTVDPRIAVQRSCFTLYGTDERDFEEMFKSSALVKQGHFVKYTIPRSKAPAALDELQAMGVSFSSIYPDFAGLASELRLRFGPPPRIMTLRRCVGRASHSSS